MSRFSVVDLPLAGLKRVDRVRLSDQRGSLSRLFCADELASAGWDRPVVQITHTCTGHRGTVRGIHFQHPPHVDMKLVSCIRGRVFDVAIDLRAGSPTFAQWHAEELDAESGGALLLPAGFAHGFQALTDDAELLYCHSAAHAPDAEAGLNPRDERLAIAWPLPIIGLSLRDETHPRLGEHFEGLRA